MLQGTVRVGADQITITGENLDDFLMQRRMWDEMAWRTRSAPDARFHYRKNAGEDGEEHEYVELRSQRMARKNDPNFKGGNAVLYVSRYKANERPHPQITHFIAAATPWQRWNYTTGQQEVFFESYQKDGVATIHEKAVESGFVPDTWTPAEKVKRKGQGYVWVPLTGPSPLRG